MFDYWLGYIFALLVLKLFNLILQFFCDNYGWRNILSKVSINVMEFFHGLMNFSLSSFKTALCRIGCSPPQKNFFDLKQLLRVFLHLMVIICEVLYNHNTYPYTFVSSERDTICTILHWFVISLIIDGIFWIRGKGMWLFWNFLNNLNYKFMKNGTYHVYDNQVIW